MVSAGISHELRTRFDTSSSRTTPQSNNYQLIRILGIVPSHFAAHSSDVLWRYDPTRQQ